jgi:hypothetical protein
MDGMANEQRFNLIVSYHFRVETGIERFTIHFLCNRGIELKP